MLLHHIFDLMGLVVMLLLLALVLAGWGRLLVRLIGLPLSNNFSTLDIWFGFVAVLGSIELLNLAFSIDWKISLVLSLVGIASLSVFYKIEWKNLPLRIVEFIRKSPWESTVIVMIVVVCGSQAMESPTVYDSGLYHFQSIRWLNEYSIVPGLGNLHGRLAYNQSYFGFIAFANFFPFWNKGYAIGGLFLLFLSIASLIELSIHRLKGGAFLLILLLLAMWSLVGRVASPAPDMPICLLQILIFSLLLKVMTDEPDQSEMRYEVLLFLLCIAIVTIKLSAAIYALANIFVLLWLKRKYFFKFRNIIFRTLFISIVLFITHIIRSYIYSGVPLYPSTIAGAWGLGWAMPIEAINIEANWIYSWARHPKTSPDIVLGNWDWLSFWLISRSKMFWMTFAMSIFIPLMHLFYLKIYKIKAQYSEKCLLLIYIPLVSSVVFWFFTAPEPRFLGLTLELLVIFSTWLFVVTLLNLEKINYLFKVLSPKKQEIFMMLFSVLILQKAKNLSYIGWSEILTAQIEVKTTNSGLKVRVTKKDSDQCWDEPLPCTPYFLESLESVNHDNTSNFVSGFKSKAELTNPDFLRN